jgi:ElaB/YqjD/DUF883 family membrane-anchored ribosome-binding protein
MTPDPMQSGNPAYRDDIREFQEDADAALQSAKQQLAEVLDGVTQRARDYGRYADEQVQANPWTAVGVSFGIGVAMGVLLGIAARR